MATPKKWVKVALFLSSYFPLWIIFLVTFLATNQGVFIIETSDNGTALIPEHLQKYWHVIAASLALAFIAVFPLMVLRRLIQETTSSAYTESIKITGKEELTGEYMLYVITYVFPFLTERLLDYTNGIALLGIMITIGILYIRANLFHVNPTLMLFSYRLFKVTDQHNTYYLLTKREQIFNNLTIRAYSMSSLIYIEKPADPTDKSAHAETMA